MTCCRYSSHDPTDSRITQYLSKVSRRSPRPPSLLHTTPPDRTLELNHSRARVLAAFILCHGNPAGRSGAVAASGHAGSQHWQRSQQCCSVGGAGGNGGDRVRRLDGGHGQQQPDRHDAAFRLPAVRARHAGRRPRHGPVRQRSPPSGLHLRVAGPAAARPGVPGPGLRHQGLRPRRLLRVRRHRRGQRHRRRPVSDPAVEGGGVLQGVPAPAARLRRRRARPRHRPRRAPRRQHRHQRLPGKLLHARHGPLHAVHGARVLRLPRRRRAAVPVGDPPPRRAAGHLRGALPHRLPPAGAHHQHLPRRRLQRGVQPGGQGVQREGGRHGARPPRRAPDAQARLRPRLRRHARLHRQPCQVRAGERGGRVLRHGEVRDGVHVQRRDAHDLRRRRQVSLLGRLPPHPEGEPDHGQQHPQRLLPARRPVNLLSIISIHYFVVEQRVSKLANRIDRLHSHSDRFPFLMD